MSLLMIRLRWFIAVLTVAAIHPHSAPAKTALTAEEIIQNAVEHAGKSSVRPNGYTYTKIAVTEELDSAGKVKERKEKVYQVSFDSGRTHSKLMTVNGKAPSEAEVKKHAENEKTGNDLMGSKSNRETQRENFLTAEMVARFDFKLEGESEVNGRAAYE